MYEVAVIGLGIYGSAILESLTARGINTVGVDQSTSPGLDGASHGSSRIIRETTLESPEYLPLIRRSLQSWRRAHDESGGQLLIRSGIVMAAEPGTDSQTHHGVQGIILRAQSLARGAGIKHEMLSGSELRSRFPDFVVSPGAIAFYEPGALIVNPERSVAFFQEKAKLAGAEIMAGHHATDLGRQDGILHFTVDGCKVRCRRAVLATGAWQHASLIPFRAVRALVYPQLVMSKASTTRRRIPPFVYLRPNHRLLYGIPAQPELSQFKACVEQYDVSVPSIHGDRMTLTDQLAHEIRSGIATLLPGQSTEDLQSDLCHYTVTARNHLVVKLVPQLPGVTVVSACSGHGFKYAPAIADQLAIRIAAELS